jgi:hypothetical protein
MDRDDSVGKNRVAGAPRNGRSEFAVWGLNGGAEFQLTAITEAREPKSG